MYSATLSNTVTNNSDGTHDLKVWVSAYTGFDHPSLFVMQKAPVMIPVSDTVIPVNVFMTVVSPSSLVEYKVGTPEEGSLFFLSDHASFRFKGASQIEDTVSLLQARINVLCKNMNKFDDVTGINNTVTCGNFGVAIFYTCFLPQYDQMVALTITGTVSKVLLKNRVPGIGDTFIGVCSPEDINKYPTALATGVAEGYFRDDTVSLIFNNGSTMLECVDLIKEYLVELSELLA